MSAENAPVNAANPEVAPLQSSADAPAQEGAPAPAGPSKSELKKRAKEAEKTKKAAERAAREEEERKKREARESEDTAKQNYGKLPLHQSQERNGASSGGFARPNTPQARNDSSFTSSTTTSSARGSSSEPGCTTCVRKASLVLVGVLYKN